MNKKVLFGVLFVALLAFSACETNKVVEDKEEIVTVEDLNASIEYNETEITFSFDVIPANTTVVMKIEPLAVGVQNVTKK